MEGVQWAHGRPILECGGVQWAYGSLILDCGGCPVSSLQSNIRVRRVSGELIAV